MEDATAPPLPLDPPPSPDSGETITPLEYVRTEGEYLRLVNDLKKQFDEHKLKTDRELRRLTLRISRMVDKNSQLEWKNVKLTNMFLKLSAIHYAAGTTWN